MVDNTNATFVSRVEIMAIMETRRDPEELQAHIDELFEEAERLRRKMTEQLARNRRILQDRASAAGERRKAPQQR